MYIDIRMYIGVYVHFFQRGKTQFFFTHLLYISNVNYSFFYFAPKQYSLTVF